MTIILALAGGSLFVFRGNDSRTVNREAHTLSGLLEYARTEAITRQTYVWVGLKTSDDGGGGETDVGAVYSKDGTGTNVDPSNLAPLCPLVRLDHARLASRNALKPATLALFDQATVSLAQNTQGISFLLGTTEFAASTLTFTPSGGVLLKGAAGPDDGYDAFIDVSFRQTKGRVVAVDASEAALLVDGSNGTVRILQSK